MTEIIRVLVVDNHALSRQGVARSLNAASDITVIGEASSGEEALAMASNLMPDIVLLDISLQGPNGWLTIKKVTTACPATRVIILTVCKDGSALLETFEAGARACMFEGISAQELLTVIRAVNSGELFVSPSLAAEILVSLNRRPILDPLQKLTAREQEILECIGAGLSNREIAEQLQLSEKAVKYCVINVFHKLQMRSKVEAALDAAQ